MSAMAEQNSKTDKAAESTFRLLSLPPELWSRICRLAVTCDQPTVIEAHMSSTKAQDTVQQPPITRTCKVIREETIDVFYANSFVYEDDYSREDNLWDWLERISADGQLRHSMPNLVIRSSWDLHNRGMYPEFYRNLDRAGVYLEVVNLDETNDVFKFKVVPKGPAGTF
ncbi:hypothetical protein LTR27_009474 [Elasticomyces elasticus]|nr:hypothetical protein LTR27_009474 [Elasticomyces elasticus]